jgi:hypothetical protein
VKLPRLVFPGRTWLKLQRLSKQNERTKPVWQLPVGESSLAPILQNSSLSPLTNKVDRLSLASLIFQWQCTKPTLKVSSLLSEALTLREILDSPKDACARINATAYLRPEKSFTILSFW